MAKGSLDNYYKTQFHIAALWGAITFVRQMTNATVSTKLVIEEFKKYFGFDEDSLPTDSATISYYRLNDRIRRSISGSEKEKLVFQSEMIESVKELKDAIDKLYVTCNVTHQNNENADGYMFHKWTKENNISISSLAKLLKMHRSRVYTIFKTITFTDKLWKKLEKIKYYKHEVKALEQSSN